MANTNSSFKAILVLMCILFVNKTIAGIIEVYSPLETEPMFISIFHDGDVHIIHLSDSIMGMVASFYQLEENASEEILI